MSESVTTASGVISFAERLEDHSAELYRELAERFPEEREAFLSLAKESEKIKTSVTRTYRETISDALETGFSFGGLDLSDYQVDAALGQNVDYAEAMTTAVALEATAAAFYEDVGKRSRSLLATISMAFKSAARRKKRREQKLQSLLERRV